MKSNHHPEVSSPEKQKTSTELPASIPVHRVYEMRGTLFYEINGTVLLLSRSNELSHDQYQLTSWH